MTDPPTPAPPTPRRIPRAVWLAMFLYVLCATITVFGVGHSVEVFPLDENYYDALAENLAAGRGWTLAPPTRHWKPMEEWIAEGKPLHHYYVWIEEATFAPPVYPAMVAGLYRIAGHRHRLVFAIQIFFGAAQVLALFLLGRQLLGETVAKIASFVWALYPPAWIFAGMIVTESLYLAAFLASLVLLVRAFQHPTPRRMALAGAALAASVHVRPVLLFLPLFLLPWFLVQASWRPGPWIRRYGPFLAGFVLVALPWSIRSSWITGRPVFILEGESSELFAGNRFYEKIALHDPVDLGALAPRVMLRACKERFEILRKNGPAKTKGILVEGAWESLGRWWREARGRFGLLMLSKLVHLWLEPDRVASDAQVRWWWKRLVHLPLLALAAVALFATRRRGWGFAPIHALFLYTTLFTLAGVSDYRYHYPLMPLVVLFAMACVVGIVRRVRGRRAWDFLPGARQGLPMTQGGPGGSSPSSPPQSLVPDGT